MFSSTGIVATLVLPLWIRNIPSMHISILLPALLVVLLPATSSVAAAAVLRQTSDDISSQDTNNDNYGGPRAPRLILSRTDVDLPSPATYDQLVGSADEASWELRALTERAQHQLETKYKRTLNAEAKARLQAALRAGLKDYLAKKKAAGPRAERSSIERSTEDVAASTEMLQQQQQAHLIGDKSNERRRPSASSGSNGGVSGFNPSGW